MTTNGITRDVIGAAMRVHTALGPGLLESTYRACLCRELELSGLRYLTEVPVPITYRGHDVLRSAQRCLGAPSRSKVS